MSGKVFPLQDNQAHAVAPERSVWLSASAGTGKTQVLSARVLRLLLRPDVAPGQILCLTFTKAGASEMAERVNSVLASWVRMPDTRLAQDLIAIGASPDAETIARARTLFASVLDCPGGGLRIDTIHAFSQWLLAAFPDEAGLMPGTRPMEDRDRDLLAHKVLAAMVAEAEETGDAGVLRPLAMLSERMGPADVPGWLMRCAAARDLWSGPGSWQPPMRERLMTLFGMPADAGEASLAELCADGMFDCAALDRMRAANASWGTATALKSLDAIADFLGASGMGRVSAADALGATLFTQKGEPRSLSSLEKQDPDYAIHAEAVAASLAAVRDRRALLALVAMLEPALAIGRRFALAWEEAKAREGLIDFDDQIRRAAALLSNADVAPWIRYKLDRRFDHVLVDEAQDTNSAQWDIVRAVTDDFFSGEGQRPGRQRTLFVVGDYKQAIFGFQGTSPRNFASAKRYYQDLIDQLAAGDPGIDPLLPLGLGRSYRTSQPVLDFVDAAIRSIGPERFGLGPDEPLERHLGYDRPGLVRMWQPVSARGGDDEDTPDDWLSEPERAMADKIAAQVAAWMRDGFPLSKDRGRNAGPGDILVLVRKRRELAGLIVARLHASSVPVAGVDRLRLGAPLGVKDLMAALRFAAQPLDDLNLANLLVSPLVGWSQEDLLEHGYREGGRRLWDHLRRGETALQQATVARLLDLLRIADFEPPQAMLRWMLVGPWQGRKALVARLGPEVNDPVDELLNAASAYAATSTASLAGFIAWFDAGEGELKRESEGAGELVRVMTVHGSKGLQAPIVILADAAGNPHTSRPRGLTLAETLSGGGGKDVPLPALSKAEKAGPVMAAEEAAKAADLEEHWRLLYVAMTRAEEALFIGGALGKKEVEPNVDSWYGQLSRVMEASEAIDDAIWGARRDLGSLPAPIARAGRADEALDRVFPEWLSRPIGPEPRPPQPLAPSSAGSDRGADPPLPPEVARIAARRGVLLHRLLERLPDVAPVEREAAARAWLARQGSDLDANEREEMLQAALVVLAEPEFGHVFAPGALAEVPLAATVGGQVIAGTADRLLVESNRVTVVDFKTARRPPVSLAEVPESTLRQMAAYAAALEVIYPGREIRAAVLYTQTPQLFEIPAAMLDTHKSLLSTKSESFPAAPVE